jgi:spore coat polysaccharide biosynthesis protein SpsF
MESTRLPGKVLRDLGGASMLARVTRRVQRASLPQEVSVATTVKPADDAVAAEAQRLGVAAFRGDEQDVLDRFYRAAQSRHADAVVRITADCPFIDPGLIDEVVRKFLETLPDYASNCLERTYPRGLDTEIMSMEALARAWKSATEPSQRTHVTPYLYQNPAQFKLVSVKAEQDYARHRWTVDTLEDLEFARAVYARLNNRDDFAWREVLRLVEEDPALEEINRGVRQKELREG